MSDQRIDASERPGANPVDRRARVAYFVSPSKHFAGIERVVHEIATGLAEAYGDRLDVHVVFASAYDEETLQHTLYTRHTLGAERLRELPAALRAVIKAGEFDVVICPQVEASVTGWIATRGLGVPAFVAHLHGNPRLEEREGSRRTKAAFALFRHLISRRIPAILAVSPSLERYANASLSRGAPVWFAKNPVRQLPQAVDRPPRDTAFRFVNVARLSTQKGQDQLLHALALARAQLPAVTLALVGEGPEEAALKHLSAQLGLDDIVEFVGYSTDPSAHLAAADCFVFSSRWEGFGVVLIEALQFGLPLLATDCEFGPADVITDDRIGDLVPAGDVRALADGMIRAAGRGWNDQDVAHRREFAQTFLREPACEMHFGLLQRIARTRASGSTRLAALAGAGV